MLLNPDEIILRNTGTKTSGTQKLVAGVVQSELNDIFNTKLAVDGWYGSQTAGTVKDLQKELSLPKTGVLDAQTFYQLEMAYENGAKYKRSVSKTKYTGASTKTQSHVQLTSNSAPTVPGDYNGNGISDRYEKYNQDTSNSAPSVPVTGNSGYQYAFDYRSYLTDPQGTGKNDSILTKDIKIDWEKIFKEVQIYEEPELKIGSIYPGGSINLPSTIRTGKAELPTLDSTGKVHGKLPSPNDLKNYANEELWQLRQELKQSVQQRIKKNIELGSDKSHGQRQADEQQLIKNIDKLLGDK